jgi:hypothetical protein
MFDFFMVVGDVHGVVELDVLGLELGLKDSESLRKLPLGPHLCPMLATNRGQKRRHTARHKRQHHRVELGERQNIVDQSILV